MAEEFLQSMAAIQFEFSIDNLTIVGNAGYGMIKCLENSLLVKSYWSTPGQLYLHNWKLENGAFFQIDHKAEGKCRLEFNPNKFRGATNERYLTEIIGHIVGAEFSRRDIAVDLFGLKMNEYYFLDLGARGSIEYRGRNKQLETKYVGAADSDERQRIYNKALEQGIECEWVRIEAQLRREKARALNMNPFEKIRVVKRFPENFRELKGTEKAIVTGLMADEELWAELDKKTRKKYKEILSHKAEIIDVAAMFREKAEDIGAEAETWLNYSHSNEGGTVIQIGKTVLAEREEDLPKVNKKEMEKSLESYLKENNL